MGLIKPPHKSKARLVFKTLRHEMSLMDYAGKHSEEPFTERDWPTVLKWVQDLWTGEAGYRARYVEMSSPIHDENYKDLTLYFARGHFFPKTYEAATVIGDFLKHAGEID